MNIDNQNSFPDNDPTEKRQRFLPNNRYFTISIYAMVVFTLGLLIVRVVMTPFAVTNGIQRIFAVLMPFLIGVLIAMILNPIINRLYTIMTVKFKWKNQRVCHITAGIISYGFVIGLILLCIIFIVPQIFTSISELVNSLPKLYQMTYQFFNTLQTRFPNLDVSSLQKMVNDALPNMISQIRSFASDIVPALYTASVSIVMLVANTFIAIIVSVYILADKQGLKKIFKIILYSFMPKKYIAPAVHVLRECNSIFTSFIVSKAVDSLIIGLLCFLFMTIFRMEYALLISVIVGITNMIPYFGPFIGAVPGVLVLLISNPLSSLGFLVLIFVLQQFDGLFLGPKLMGDSVGMKPLAIIISITIGGKIAGVLGMFLSVPIGAIIGYLLNLLIDHQLKKRNLTRDSF